MVYTVPPPRSPEMVEVGDWSIDNHSGREYASKLIAEARISGNPLQLCRAIGEMVRRGEYGAAEVGFVFKVAASTL